MSCKSVKRFSNCHMQTDMAKLIGTFLQLLVVNANRDKEENYVEIIKEGKTKEDIRKKEGKGNEQKKETKSYVAAWPCENCTESHYFTAESVWCRGRSAYSSNSALPCAHNHNHFVIN